MRLSHLIYTVRPCMIHNYHAAPMPSPTMPFFSRPRHSTACGLLARVRFLPAITRSSTKLLSDAYQSQMQVASLEKKPFAWTRKRLEAAHYKKDDLLHCRTSSSDISGYHSDIHERHGTVGAGQGRGMA